MRGEDGFSLVELMVASLVMVIGILGTVGVLDAARRLTAGAERQTSMIHRAQLEVERIQALPFAKVAMAAVPSHSATASNPDYYVIPGTPTTFQYDRNIPAATEQFAVDAANGAISSNGIAWTDGRLSGAVYSFVTNTADPNCSNGTNCPVTGDYKRITVAVTLTGSAHPSRPAIISTFIADPNSAATGYVVNGVQNPLQSPSTQCLNAQNVLVVCTNGLQTGSADTWYLYDTPSFTTIGGGLFGVYNTVRQSIAGNHSTHPTIAVVDALTCGVLGVVTGCQNPDTMGAAPPPQDGTTPVTPYCYTNDTGCSGGGSPGGRTIPPSIACNAANPWSTNDNHKGAFWVTNGVAAATKLTGAGGMVLNAETSSGVTASVTICVGIYVVPASILGLLTLPPVLVGVVAYAIAAFPSVITPISFNFNFLAANTTYLVAAGSRIGVRVWVDASSASGVTLVYDHPQFGSALQLNTQ